MARAVRASRRRPAGGPGAAASVARERPSASSGESAGSPAGGDRGAEDDGEKRPCAANAPQPASSFAFARARTFSIASASFFAA